MKDLKLKVGDKCYIGREEWKCIATDNGDIPYKIHNGDRGLWIYGNGKTIESLISVVSLEPYDFPEMVYEKPLEIGMPHYFWDDKTIAVYYSILVGTKGCAYLSLSSGGVRGNYTHCSPTPPDLTK